MRQRINSPTKLVMFSNFIKCEEWIVLLSPFLPLRSLQTVAAREFSRTVVGKLVEVWEALENVRPHVCGEPRDIMKTGASPFL